MIKNIANQLLYYGFFTHDKYLTLNHILSESLMLSEILVGVVLDILVDTLFTVKIFQN